ERPLSRGVGHVYLRDSDLRLAHRIVGVEHRSGARLVFRGDFRHSWASACDIEAVDRVAAPDGIPGDGGSGLFPVSVARARELSDGGCLPARSGARDVAAD